MRIMACRECVQAPIFGSGRPCVRPQLQRSPPLALTCGKSSTAFCPSELLCRTTARLFSRARAENDIVCVRLGCFVRKANQLKMYLSVCFFCFFLPLAETEDTHHHDPSHCRSLVCDRYDSCSGSHNGPCSVSGRPGEHEIILHAVIAQYHHHVHRDRLSHQPPPFPLLYSRRPRFSPAHGAAGVAARLAPLRCPLATSWWAAAHKSRSTAATAFC